MCCLFFFFKDPATTEIYTYGHTLSLHDALPISRHRGRAAKERADLGKRGQVSRARAAASHLAASPGMVVDLAEILGEDHGSVVPSAISRAVNFRSEEHTSELQSLMRISYAVFCLKKKNVKNN